MAIKKHTCDHLDQEKDNLGFTPEPTPEPESTLWITRVGLMPLLATAAPWASVLL